MNLHSSHNFMSYRIHVRSPRHLASKSPHFLARLARTC